MAMAMAMAMALPFVECRMFNAAVSAQPTPAYLSTDHAPLFRFHRWRANLRIREIDEIKSVPFVPTSHPFVERLIGTVRRAYLDRVFFWNSVDLTDKLAAFGDYYNTHRVHRSLDGTAARSPRGFIDSHARFVQTLHLATSLRRAVSDPDGGVTTNSPPTGSSGLEKLTCQYPRWAKIHPSHGISSRVPTET